MWFQIRKRATGSTACRYSETARTAREVAVPDSLDRRQMTARDERRADRDLRKLNGRRHEPGLAQALRHCHQRHARLRHQQHDQRRQRRREPARREIADRTAEHRDHDQHAPNVERPCAGLDDKKRTRQSGAYRTPTPPAYRCAEDRRRCLPVRLSGPSCRIAIASASGMRASADWKQSEFKPSPRARVSIAGRIA